MILSLEEAKEYINIYRKFDKIIVSTNGCFDIIHAGHINYLEFAKSKGDILIIGVNTDESVRELKGNGRPINSLEERMMVLNALKFVDIVCSFPEKRPINFLSEIKPDIHIKGGDYKDIVLPEAEIIEKNNGRIELAPIIAGKSTTDLLTKINHLFDSGLLP